MSENKPIESTTVYILYVMCLVDRQPSLHLLCSELFGGLYSKNSNPTFLVTSVPLVHSIRQVAL